MFKSKSVLVIKESGASKATVKRFRHLHSNVSTFYTTTQKTSHYFQHATLFSLLVVVLIMRSNGMQSTLMLY